MLEGQQNTGKSIHDQSKSIYSQRGRSWFSRLFVCARDDATHSPQFPTGATRGVWNMTRPLYETLLGLTLNW